MSLQGDVLCAITALRPDGSAERIDAPLIPTLLTNAPGEPHIGSQHLAEIHSARVAAREVEWDLALAAQAP